MKDEIKERIKYFKHYVVDNLSLDAQDDFQEILDCITNLQEENKKLKEYQESYRKELDYWRLQFSNKEEKINKAMEILNKVDFDMFVYTKQGLKDIKRYLLKALQGDDKEC